MQTEFVCDDQKNMWFTYASKVHARQVNQSQSNQLLMQYASMLPNTDTLQRVKEEEKDHILREIEEIERVQSTKDRLVHSRMSNHFNSHYAKMKEDIGIDENFGFMEENPILEDVLKDIHTNTDPHNFKHLLRKT